MRAVEKIAADGEKPGKMPQFSHKDSFYKEIEISLESRLGRRVTVTAGPTQEALDPVPARSNISAVLRTADLLNS